MTNDTKWGRAAARGGAGILPRRRLPVLARVIHARREEGNLQRHGRHVPGDARRHARGLPGLPARDPGAPSGHAQHVRRRVAPARALCSTGSWPGSSSPRTRTPPRTRAWGGSPPRTSRGRPRAPGACSSRLTPPRGISMPSSSSPSTAITGESTAITRATTKARTGGSTRQKPTIRSRLAITTPVTPWAIVRSRRHCHSLPVRNPCHATFPLIVLRSPFTSSMSLSSA